MVFFWACEVTETKAAVVKIPESYVLNVCHATLASASTDGVLSLGLETTQMDDKIWKGVVAHLGAAAHQVKLDLVVGSTGSQQIKFYIAKGTGKINLTGYFQPGPPADLLDAPTVVTSTEVEAATPAQVQSAPKKSKKRARDEKKANTTWDQAASDSDSDGEKEETKPEPVKKQAKKEDSESKKSAAPTPTPAPAQENGAAEGAKKKRKNKNKNKNKEKKDN